MFTYSIGSDVTRDWMNSELRYDGIHWGTIYILGKKAKLMFYPPEEEMQFLYNDFVEFITRAEAAFIKFELGE